MKKSAAQRAVDQIQSEINVLEQVKARLIEAMQEKIARAPRKPRAVKPAEQKAG